MKRIALLLIFTLLAHNLFAGSVIAVLEYHQGSSQQKETGKFSDRLRDELLRRYQSAVLTREETADLFFYHKRGVLKGGRILSHSQLEEGKKAYFELKLPEAQKILQRLALEEGEETGVDAHFLLGLTELAQGNEPEARQSFEEVLRLDPRHELDPSFFPPKVVKFFKKVKEDLHPATAALKITANPVGSEVWINGVFAGLVPLDLSAFPAGKHIVRIQANHYYPVVKKIQLTPGSGLVMNNSLPWDSGQASETVLGFSESEIGGSDRLVPVASGIGHEMGAGKVLLVSYLQKAGDSGEIETTLVDVNLGTSHKSRFYPVTQISENSAQVAAAVADQIQAALKEDLKERPDRYAENRYQGDVILIGRYHKAFYKRPIFWILMGAVAGAGGGVAAAALSTGPATGSLGIVFQ